MSKIYDNWEKLVDAVLRREKDRHLALCLSFSSSSSADVSSRSSLSSNPFLEMLKLNCLMVICEAFGFSGIDDFAISPEEYKAMKVVSSSSSSSGMISKKLEPLYQEIEVDCDDFVRFCNGNGNGYFGARVNDKLSVRSKVARWNGIEGVRPTIVVPTQDTSEGFLVDRVPCIPKVQSRFSSNQEECEVVGWDRVEQEKDMEVMAMIREENGALSESCSFSSNEDDSSSLMTEPGSSISSNERYGRVIHDWQKGELLGRGRYGSVYEGISDDGFFFAVKEVPLLDQKEEGKQCIIQLGQEIALLSQFEHENIVQYYGTQKDGSHLYIFLELVSKGSLLRLYREHELRVPQVSDYTRQILHGLKYLHDRNVIHRDIKCANVLVDTNGSVKLADFGLAKAAQLNDVTSWKGACWMAPEVVRTGSKGYGLAADIWSLGCTVLEMLTGRFPYFGLEQMSALFKIGRGERPDIPDTLSSDARDFILQCLQVDPNLRPTAAQLLDHPFVKPMVDAVLRIEKYRHLELYLSFSSSSSADLSSRFSLSSNPFLEDAQLPHGLSFLSGTNGEFEVICEAFGFSGIDDFAISPEEYKAMKVVSSSSSSSGMISKKLEPLYQEIEVDCDDFVRFCNGNGNGYFGARVNDKLSVRSKVARWNGIEGVRPTIVVPTQDTSEGFLVDRVPCIPKVQSRFSLNQEECEVVGWDRVEQEKDMEVMAMIREENGALSESCSFSSNEDDSSSLMTEPGSSISSNERYGRVIHDWQKGELLGRGRYGSVYEGISDDGFFFAVKEVPLLDQKEEGKQCIIQLGQEIALLSQFEHENIVQYYGTQKDGSHLYIFLELVSKGSLLRLYRKDHLQVPQVSTYTRQILHGLKYLHDRNVIHRDIKCANILVHANGLVKLADFGLAKTAKLNDVKSCKGTAFWMAPEVVRRKGYGLAADIWSLGCTVLEMLTRHFPYFGLEYMSALFKIGCGERPDIPDTLSSDARDFILQCLQVDPNLRPTAAQLLDHPFVKRPLLRLQG